MEKIKNIAIIAMESKKTDLIEWSYFNKTLLFPHELFALGFAANTLEGTLNKKINKAEDLKLGGHRILCRLITDNKIDAVIIFGDAEEIFDSNDLKSVLQVAVENNIITAINKTSADFMLHSSLLESEYKIDLKEKKPVEDKKLIPGTNDYVFAKAS